MRSVAFAGVFSLLAGAALALAGCTGDAGTSCTVKANANGTKTISCTDGTSATVTDGSNGANGTNGTNGTSCTVKDTGGGTKTITCTDGTSVVVKDGTAGQNGGNVAVGNFHGETFLQSTGEFANGAKSFVNATITGATAAADGTVTVNFTVTDAAKKPVTGLTAVQGLVAKLQPGTDGSPSRWVDYLQRVQTVSGSATGNWPNPDGTKARQGSRENNGTLSGGADGKYTYTFASKLTNMATDGVAIPYERNLTHRVQIMMGGHSGPTAEATFDFVPDGSAMTTTRDIVPTSACVSCHGPEFAGHGGDRLTMPGCVTCHSSPGGSEEGVDPHGGQSIDMTVMIHKIHAGAALPSAPGPDGVIWDDPATPEDESADNGVYAIWGNSNSKHAWGKAEFPAVIENCTVCHRGDGAQADNWKKVPSRKACSSCHDDVDFMNGTNHPAGLDSDKMCSVCHPADGFGVGKSVSVAHDFSNKDIRNIPEFAIDLKVSAPPNGKFFVTGDVPVVSVILSKDGTPIDHRTVVEDPAGEGCTPVAGKEGSQCAQTPDGLFRNANMYVTGPRALRVPVLTKAARAVVLSGTKGPWDLSAGGATLRVVVDSGNFIVGYDPAGEDRLIAGDFTVTLPKAGADLNALFANPAAATVDELVAWLMSDAAEFEYNERAFFFRDRAVAFKDESTGKLALRSRPTIANTNIMVPDLAAAPTSLNQVLFTDHAVKVTGGAVQLRARTNAANTDPKVTLTADKITYTLDPIDGYLKAGTYVVNVEFADLGRGATSDSYRTPSVAVATFQVKQAEEEKPIAANCTSCHWSSESNTGYVLDFPRHNKVFNEQVMDQCGGCHDYASAESVAAPTWSTGGSTKPIARRVHSIHNGANLVNPVITVDHEESVPGRNWQITYPQDIRNCESCHPKDKTSGSWMTNANRIACMGCHDTDGALAHMKAMTYDPTPSAAWSGDEQESCKACH